jgi:hypothetical protein
MIDPPVQTVPAIPTLSSVLCNLQPTAHLPKARPDYVSTMYMYRVMEKTPQQFEGNMMMSMVITL